MDLDTFRQLVEKRQSCRSFTDKPIERDTIEQIIDVARLSPSACNTQPWSFIVMAGEKAREVAKFMQAFGNNKFVANCPVFVAIVEEKANLAVRLGKRFWDQDFTSNDIGICAAHFVLAAETAGVDSCILGAFKEDSLKTFLGVSKRIRLIIALGYATEGYEIRKKVRKIDNLVEYRGF